MSRPVSKQPEVLMGVRDYDELQESLALLKILAMGRKSIEKGKGIPMEEAFANIERRIAENDAE